jgi:hypothetical protein
VKAENAGGVARDSVKLVFETECIKVNFDPAELSVGDTSRLSFQRVKEDGTVEDLPEGLYMFSVTIVAGEDSSRGLFVTDEEEPEGGTTLLNASAPILYVAPSSIPDTSMRVQVVASAWEVIWWKRDEVKDQVAGVQQLSAKKAEGQGGRGIGGVIDPVTAARLAAMASSWCPISQVTVEGSPLDHFLVSVEPDTIAHGDTAKVLVQAKDRNDGDIDPATGTLVNVVLSTAEIYGNLLYRGQRGNTLVDVPYADANSGKVAFVADGENPVNEGPQTVVIGVTEVREERVAGTGSVVVRPSIEKFCQDDPRWSGTKYDEYVRKKKDGTGDSTDAQGNKVYHTVGSKGCALTCMAMVAKEGGADTDPGKLAEYLDAHNGFQDASVKWAAINSGLGNSKYVFDGYNGGGLKYKKENGKQKIDLGGSTPINLTEIDYDLSNGALIIAQVYNPTTGNQHFVLVTEKKGDVYKILDPGCYEGRTDITAYSGNIYKIAVYGRKRL